MTLDPWSLELQRLHAQALPKLEGFARQLLSLIEALCVAHKIDVEGRSWRIKSVESASRKLREDKELDQFSDLRDLCGIRVVVATLTDVRRVCGLLHDELEVREEQWLGEAQADVFGYRSLHLQVRIDTERAQRTEWLDLRACEAEVQVRTLLQDSWAVVSRKYDYKSSRAAPDNVRRQLFRVASLIETSDETFDHYCAEVRAAREGYQRLASTSEWTSLPLDYDSLLITWDKYEWEAVADRSREIGYADARDDPELLLREDDDVTGLVFIAQASDVHTTGELADFVSRIANGERDADLSEVQLVASKRGLHPYAVGWQVTTMCLLIDHPTEVDKSVLSPHLRKAIVEVAAGKS